MKEAESVCFCYTNAEEHLLLNLQYVTDHNILDSNLKYFLIRWTKNLDTTDIWSKIYNYIS